MERENIKSYIVEAVLRDDVLNEILGSEGMEIWRDYLEYKVDRIVDSLGYVGGDVVDKVVSSWLVRLRKFVVGVHRAVRDNYSLGEEAILKALIEVFKSGV